MDVLPDLGMTQTGLTKTLSAKFAWASVAIFQSAKSKARGARQRRMDNRIGTQ